MPTAGTATGPAPTFHCHQATPCSPPTSLPTGTNAHAPPLPRAGTIVGQPCHLGIAASLDAIIVRAPEHCIIIVTQAVVVAPTAASSYLGAREESAAATAIHIAGIVLKAGEEATTPTAPLSITV
jgi:hypothetical protein